MKKATIFTLSLFLMAGLVEAQDREFLLNIPNSTDLTQGYATGFQSGARGISGPYDLDNDNLYEVIVSDYTGGGRAHVVENVGPDTWELVYSTPWNDSTSSSQNGRYAVGADLDGDGMGEIVMLSGRSYSETNPNFDALPPGLHVYEFTGTDNDYGTAPASIYEFDGDLPDRWRSEQMVADDVDGDGVQEVMFPNNGSDNGYDNWYVLSVTGDIGTSFETWIEEARFSSRSSETFDPVNRGGGSPASIHAADLDGDGTKELSMSSWNAYNFTNADITGADTYVAPAEGAPNAFLHASGSGDDVSLFGGVVVDIDRNGDDEIFYPILCWGGGSPLPTCNSVSVLNYESGEDVLQVTMDNIGFAILENLGGLGITISDMDGDGFVEIVGSGNGYSAASFEAGDDPAFVRIAEFNGGDPEDASNYSIETLMYSEDFDTDGSNFDLIQRDSAGVMTEYYEANNGGDFVSKMANLGDADNDARNEIALAFQSIGDSSFVYSEVFNPSDSTYTRTVVSAQANENRVFMRVLSGGPGFATSIEDERVIVPSDYKLNDNYPNPFNPNTTISFTLPIDKAISVKVYDMTGQLVRTIVNSQFYSEGSHEVVWDATNDFGQQVASGSYLYTLEYGNFRQSKTMILLK